MAYLDTFDMVHRRQDIEKEQARRRLLRHPSAGMGRHWTICSSTMRVIHSTLEEVTVRLQEQGVPRGGLASPALLRHLPSTA
jgi:hypothetical protein